MDFKFAIFLLNNNIDRLMVAPTVAHRTRVIIIALKWHQRNESEAAFYAQIFEIAKKWRYGSDNYYMYMANRNDLKGKMSLEAYKLPIQWLYSMVFMDESPERYR